jgi:[acyl-carrier-protein] S-malonyltransferase
MFDLARSDTRAAALLDDCALSTPGQQQMFENRLAQPAIVGATLSMWEALRRRTPAPSLVAGYSVGELSAYGVAGALDPVDAVHLAAIRAQLMDAAAATTSLQAMAAISGLSLERARVLVRSCGFDLAIITGQDSCVVGGLDATLAQLEQAVTLAGGRLQRLPIGVASHTALMAQAVAPFDDALTGVPFDVLACPVLSGIGAEAITDKQRAVDTLSRQLSRTIVWSECMDTAVEAGMTVALELGPGASLARMLQARHPQLACRSVADFRSIDGIVAWLGRHFEQMPMA